MKSETMNSRLEKENSLQDVGLWGQRRLQFIREERRSLYDALVAAGELNTYLSEIDRQAGDFLFQLVKQLAKQQCVTEKLKAENPMLWVQQMNNVQNAATEIVLNELIYC